MLFCKACNRQTLHVCQETNCNHILHLLLSIVTCGLWLPIWLLAAISSSKYTPICTACGSKPDNPALPYDFSEEKLRDGMEIRLPKLMN
jgi:hypothetical protein